MHSAECHLVLADLVSSWRCWELSEAVDSAIFCNVCMGSKKYRIPHHNRFTTLFQDHPGEPVPEENFWPLWCKGRLTEADTPTIRLGATPSGLSSAHLHHPHVFYRPDSLPAAQPTVSKH